MTWNEKTVAERIANPALREKVVSPEEAALIVRDGMTVGMSGFTGVGYPKAFPRALAKRAKEGDPVGITLITGASVGDELDGELARAGVTKRRYPYQTNKDLRDRINSGEIKYVDIHLGQVPVWIRQGVSVRSIWR